MPSPLDLHFAECQPPGLSPTLRDRRLRESARMFLFATLLLCIICTSCGSVASGPAAAPPPPLPVSVTVMPNSAQLFPGGNKQFNAVVANASSSAVNWQLSQPSGGNTDVGTITPTGTYTAPNWFPNPPTVTVTAALQADPTKTSSSSVTVLSLSSVQTLTLSPGILSATPSQTSQLNVLPTGIRNTDVNWAVDGIPNGSSTVGTFSTGGVPSGSIDYIAPPTGGSHLITATLNVNSGPTASATVEVTEFPGMLTWRNDNSRSGVNSQELLLSPGPGPGTVNSSTFGKLFSCPIDGYAYAQPLYVPNLAISGIGTQNVIFVATEMDSVYAFDADANPCKQLWKTSLIPPGSQAIETPILGATSANIVPFVGITGTPVIGVSTSALYVVAATQTVPMKPALSPASYSHLLYCAGLGDGTAGNSARRSRNRLADVWQPSVFDTSAENQRPALLLDNGTVYVGFGSFGEIGVYHGWLFEYDSTTLQQTGVFNVTPDSTQGGIWQSGGGPSADSNHNVFLATGDGPFGPTIGGMNFSDSFLQFKTAGVLSISDSFTPCEQGPHDTPGQDVGTGAPVLLPDSAGSTSQPHLLIGGSENGSLYVVNRDLMGGYDGSCMTDSPPRVQVVSTGSGAILSTPLFWNNSVFIAPGDGNLMSFPMSGGILASSPSTSQSPETLGPQGATPVISSNGTNNAILWLIDSSGALATPNTPAILRAYDPNNLSNEIYNSAMAAASRDAAGLAVKFTVPTVANGKVYVGTQTELDVYGLLN